jgi:HPr kinase/phosphorylase
MYEGLHLHGTAVAVDGAGLLVVGAAGRGKSALALQMIGLGAVLVADDLVTLARDGREVVMSSPNPDLCGVIEMRGLGLVRAPHQRSVPLRLIVDLDLPPPARLPEAATRDVLGCVIPLVAGAPGPHFPVALVLRLRHGHTA